MILKHRVALDGNELDQVDDRILVSGIVEQAAKATLNMAGYGWRDGGAVTEQKRDYLEIQIKFKIRVKKNNMQARSELMEAVTTWAAKGGWLTLNYRPGRRIHVMMAQGPTPGDPWKWTDEYTLTMRACGVPYWENVEPESLTLGSGTAGGVQMVVSGSAGSVCEAVFTNQSGATVNALTITTGASSMSFGNLGLANGERLVIDHDDEGLLRIRIANSRNVYRSAYSCRLGSSSDELAVKPGANTCAYSPAIAATCAISCRGRWI